MHRNFTKFHTRKPGVRTFGDAALFIHYHPNLQRPDLIKVHITLREGNRDAGPAEFLVNRLVQFVQHRQPIIDAVDEDPQFEIQAVIAKAEKYGLRFRILEDQRIGVSGLAQQFFRQQGIGTIGNADGNADADDIVRKPSRAW